MTGSADEDRITALLDDLTIAAKLTLIRGAADPAGDATAYIPGVPRLDVPPLSMVDGPMGIRDGISTAFPATIALGASWDTDLARRMGNALAAEAREKGHDVLLGPGVNLIRVPTGGRNFEYLSEDPHLAGTVAAAYVEPGDAPVPRPPRELGGFARVALDGGESTTVELSLSERAFARYDAEESEWVVASGEYGLVVGPSSRDHRVRSAIDR